MNNTLIKYPLTLVARSRKWIREQLRKPARELAVQVLCTIVGVLWLYAAVSKLADYDEARRQMLNQVFPVRIAEVLTWLIPATELVLAASLTWKPVQLPGLIVSLALLVTFSLYIAITMSNAFGRIPCSCGGIIKHLGYWQHLGFNLFFAALSAIAILFIIKSGSPQGNPAERRSRDNAANVT